MLAFEIRINGKLLVTIGHADMAVMHASVIAQGPDAERGIEQSVELRMNGMSQPNDSGYPEHSRWGECDIRIGDEVTIRAVEVTSADPPIKRYRSDKTVQECPFTEEEMREMRYADYLDLKKEFE